MADSRSGRTPTKKEMRERGARRANLERRDMLIGQKSSALSKSRELSRYRAGYGFEEEYDYRAERSPSYRSAETSAPEVDAHFATDLRKMKFCRKPVGFLMSLFFLVALVVVAFSFIPIEIPSVGPMINQYTAVYSITEPKQSAAGNSEAEQGEEESTAENAEGEAETEQSGEGAEATGEVASSDAGVQETEKSSGVYYKFSDPVYGWIKYITKLMSEEFGFDMPEAIYDLGDSSWYNTQTYKIESAGMTDKLAEILILAFPAAIILYVIYALSMFIKTFICWASGDRRIYRHTWVECLIMIVLSLVVALGGYATTVSIEGKLDFGGIVNYLIGGITGVGGFTAGFGLLIMVGLPIIELLLSFFLLERKLRSREITQPIIMYQYKDSGKKRK